MEFEIIEEFDEVGKSDDLRETGVYDVVLERVALTTNKSGSTSMSMTVSQPSAKYDKTFYQGVIQNVDGSNGFEYKRLLMPLVKVCGVKALTTGKIEVDAKNGKKEITIFTQFEPTPIKVAIQKTWSDWKSDWEAKVVAVFATSGLSATELKENISTPKQIDYYLGEKFVDKGPKNGAKPQAKNQIDIADEDMPF